MLRRIRYPRLPCCAGVAAQLFAFRHIVVTVTQFRKHNTRNFSVQLNVATKQMKVDRPQFPPPTRHEQTAPRQPPARLLSGKLIPSVLFAKVLAHLETIGAKPDEENVYLPERELHRFFCGDVLPNAVSLRLFDTSAENWFHHTQTNKAAEILEYVSHDYIPLTAGHCCFQPSDVKFLRREAKRRGITSRIWVTTKAVERANLSLREDAVRVRLPSGFVYYSNEDTSDPDLFEKNKLPFVNQEAFRAFAPACALSGKPLSFYALQTVIQHVKDKNLPLPTTEAEPRAVFLSADDLRCLFDGELISNATAVQLPGYRQPRYHYAQTNRAKEILEYVSHDYIPTNPLRGCFKPCDAEFLRKEAKERGISSRIWATRPNLLSFRVRATEDAKPVQAPSGHFLVSAEETTDPTQFLRFENFFGKKETVLSIGGYPHEFSLWIQKDPRFSDIRDASPYWMTRKEALALGTDVHEGAQGVEVDSGDRSMIFFNASQLQDPSVVTEELTSRMYICRPTLERFVSTEEILFRCHIVDQRLVGHRITSRFRHPIHIFVTIHELRLVFNGVPLPGAVPLRKSTLQRYHHTQTNKAAELIEYVSHGYVPTRPTMFFPPFPFSSDSAQFLRDVAERRKFVSRYWLTESDCIMFNTEISEGEAFVVTPDRQRVVNQEQTTNSRAITNCVFSSAGKTRFLQQQQLLAASEENGSRHPSKFADGSALIPESQKRAAAHVEKLRSKFPQVFSSLDDICGEKKETIWVSKKQLETIFDYGELLPELANKDEEEIGLRFVGQGHTRSEFITQCERNQDLFFPHWLTTRRKQIEEYASHDYIPVVLRGAVHSRGTIATPDESELKFHVKCPQGGSNATLLLRYVPRWEKKMRRMGTERLKEVLYMPGYVELLPRESCELLRVLAASRKLRSPLWATRRQIRQQGRHLHVDFKKVQEVVVYDGTIVEVFNSSDVGFRERRVGTDEFED